MTKKAFSLRLLEKQLGSMTFGKLLWLHRIGHDLSQDDLARALEVSALYIDQIERGARDPSMEQVARIAALFDSATDLFLLQSLEDQINRASLGIRPLF